MEFFVLFFLILNRDVKLNSNLWNSEELHDENTSSLWICLKVDALVV